MQNKPLTYLLTYSPFDVQQCLQAPMINGIKLIQIMRNLTEILHLHEFP